MSDTDDPDNLSDLELSGGADRITLMGRRPRLHSAGMIYHVMARGNRGQDVFTDDGHYRAFLLRLAAQKARSGFRLYAYCLMVNHFHLLIQVDQEPLSRIMQRLLTGFAQYSNERTARTGHVFQNRFKALSCRHDAYLLHLIRYIHMNPVKDRFVAKPEAWLWSGHHAYLGKKDGLTDCDWPLSLLAPRGKDALSVYLDFLGQPAPPIRTADQDPGPAALWREEELTDEHKGARSGKEAHLFGAFVSATLAALGTSEDELKTRSKARPLVRLRATFIEQALRAGYRPAQIADFLGRPTDSISKAARRTSRLSVSDTYRMPYLKSRSTT